MPTRILREGILDSLLVNSLSESAELLYRRLMSIVDDYGRFEADVDLIRARCFPRQFDRWGCNRISECIRELQFPTVDHGGSPLITVYGTKKKKYIQINNFGQRVQSKPKFPGPDSPESTVDHGESPFLTVQSESESKTYTKSDAKSLGVASPKAQPNGSRLNIQEPTLEMKRFCSEQLAWTEDQIMSVWCNFSDYWLSVAGARGRKADWLATWRTWCRREDEKISGRHEIKRKSKTEATLEEFRKAMAE